MLIYSVSKKMPNLGYSAQEFAAAAAAEQIGKSDSANSFDYKSCWIPHSRRLQSTFIYIPS